MALLHPCAFPIGRAEQSPAPTVILSEAKDLTLFQERSFAVAMEHGALRMTVWTGHFEAVNNITVFAYPTLYTELVAKSAYIIYNI